MSDESKSDKSESGTGRAATWPGKGGKAGKDVNPPGGWRVKKGPKKDKKKKK